MSRPTTLATKSQRALQSYLDSLLHEAALSLAHSELDDEFAQAVLEEQVRDARLQAQATLPAPAASQVELQIPDTKRASLPVAPPEQEQRVVQEAPSQTQPQLDVQRPEWSQEPFECLLFEVAGLTLAVPLVCLGTIYALAGQELTPLFGQPEWFLGILPGQAGNLKVIDTARWVMPERYRPELKEGLQYVLSMQGYEWGLAVHQVSRSIRLDPQQVKWRSQRTQRPWLAGTVVEHMCALLDVSVLGKLIASKGQRI